MVAAVVAACQAEVAALQQPDPARLGALQTQVERLRQKIAFNQRNVGASQEEEEETARLIKELRSERTAALAQLKTLEASQAKILQVPTPEQVGQLLDELAALLAAAAAGSAAQAGRVREVVRLLTGGRIVLQQQGERRRHGGWLQGRFVVRLLPFLVGQALASPGESEAAASAGTEIVIDFREPPQRTAESERAKELYDQGLLGMEIAARLGCSRTWVSKLLRDWQAAHGETLADGRQRRRTLVRKQATPTLPEELAEQAKALWDQGLADVQIAVQLNCSPPTAKAAVEHWHRSCGVEPPNAAARRSALLARMRLLYEQQHSLRAIAKAVGLCSRSVTLLLREHYHTQGKALPDGRARRWLKPLDGAPTTTGGLAT